MPIAAELRNDLEDVANRMRISAIEMTCASNSGHPTSSTSAAEIISTLFFHEMKYDVKNPKCASADRFVLSKGHACPILYAAWEEAGLLSKNDVMSLRKITSDIEGHPTPRLNFIDVATGSLGQGLSCAAGMAYVGKYIDKASYRVYCLMGDGENAEGAVWEAASFSSKYKLDNLVAIVDVNRLGQSQETALGHHVEIYQARYAAFGFNAIVVDGHNVDELISAFEAARNTKDKPTAIIAKTFKGQGIEGIADQENWHGKPVPADKVNAIKARLHGSAKGKLVPQKPIDDAPKVDLHVGSIKMAPPTYKKGEKVGGSLTDFVYTICRLRREQLMALLWPNSEMLIRVLLAWMVIRRIPRILRNCSRLKHPDQFIECFIAEQNLVGVAVGAQCRDRTIPFTSTFAAFFTRACDQIRMAAVSFANLKCAGSHVGVSIGEDGPSQMALEDLALFRALPGSTVFYPTDGVSAERATEIAANLKGIVFIRTGRPAMPVLYDNEEPFAVGQAKILKKSANDKIVLIGAGVTIYESMKAAEQLEKEGIHCCIIDPFTIKPLDQATIVQEAKRKHPDQFIECFIAEQNLVGVAVGAQCRDRTIPFTSTFAAFFTRACDQIRMAAVSFANLKCAGSHVGVSIGEDGPSQMALEDLALFRALPGSTVFYPTDGVSAERATEIAANLKGIVFIRTGRPAMPVLYDNEEPFAVGQAKILKKSPNDKVVLIGAGVTIYESMKAAEQLEKEGIHCCIIDPFTIKPLDQATIVQEAKRVGGKILTIEDHYPAGGIGEAVSSAVSDHADIRVRSLCVHDVPRSGKPDELLDMFGISARHIVEAVKKF
ncbi:Transketolase, thiamine diphosphate binding domain protein [Oesophagostomum dentatum]|uniref:transketolase n=1 Tax=Oesophagostomum dentatum TaxID=61180 RepID=A0A0B1SZP7_OESDE|nr:Transketolase, thiamine diphosphate binding domain protein [Oesophagostomum dentatum]